MGWTHNLDRIITTHCTGESFCFFLHMRKGRETCPPKTYLQCFRSRERNCGKCSPTFLVWSWAVTLKLTTSCSEMFCTLHPLSLCSSSFLCYIRPSVIRFLTFCSTSKSWSHQPLQIHVKTPFSLLVVSSSHCLNLHCTAPDSLLGDSC